MKYAYFPGCSLHATAAEYADSSYEICKKLGIELQEIEDWLCCGATPAHITNHLLSVSLPISSCAWAEKEKLNVLTCCAACFSRLKLANLEVRKDEKLLSRVNEIIEENYKGETEVYHLLEVITEQFRQDELKEKAVKPLKGLKAACYYGCLLTRLPEDMRIDSREEPMIMDNLIKIMGGETIKWPYKTECCGASLSVIQEKTVLRLANDILSIAKENGADCIVVACPLCQSNLDLTQSEVNKKFKKNFHLPVLYFTQLMGLALGIDKDKLGLSKLIVNPLPLLTEKGIIKEEAYL